MLWLQTAFLFLVAGAGAAVVLTREPARQAIVTCFCGLLLAILFFLYEAPGAAIAEIALGAVAVPVMVLLALARIGGSGAS